MWQSIEEMPIYNWIKIIETGDLKYIFKDKGRVSKRCFNKWIELQDEYLKEFGLDEGYSNKLKKIVELTHLNIDYVLTRDRFLFNLIKMAEADLEREGKEEAFNFWQTLDHVEKYKGYSIDPKNTPVIKWYYTLKNMTNGKAD